MAGEGKEEEEVDSAEGEEPSARRGWEGGKAEGGAREEREERRGRGRR